LISPLPSFSFDTSSVDCIYKVVARNFLDVPVHCLYFKLPSLSVEIKCQLDATEVFIADLIACSTCFGHHHAHHQELTSIIQWLLRVVFCAVVFQVAGLVWS